MIDILKKYINSKTYCLKFLGYHLTDHGIEINNILIGKQYDSIKITTNQNQEGYHSNNTIPLNNKHTYTFTVSPEYYGDFMNLLGTITPRNNYHSSQILMDDTLINRHD